MAKELIVLNPVVEGLLGNNYQRFVGDLEISGAYVMDSKGGISVVRKLYGEQVNGNLGNIPLIDSRCPDVVAMVRRDFGDLTCHLAQISPILITGALMAYEECKARHLGEEIDLTIVTPCNAFSNYVSEELPSETRLITWKDFVEERGFNYDKQVLDRSPVPLGFFDSLGMKVVGASGKDEVTDALKQFNELSSDVNILELLYCHEGCHRGNGL